MDLTAEIRITPSELPAESTRELSLTLVNNMANAADAPVCVPVNYNSIITSCTTDKSANPTVATSENSSIVLDDGIEKNGSVKTYTLAASRLTKSAQYCAEGSLVAVSASHNGLETLAHRVDMANIHPSSNNNWVALQHLNFQGKGSVPRPATIDHTGGVRFPSDEFSVSASRPLVVTANDLEKPDSKISFVQQPDTLINAVACHPTIESISCVGSSAIVTYASTNIGNESIEEVAPNHDATFIEQSFLDHSDDALQSSSSEMCPLSEEINVSEPQPTPSKRRRDENSKLELPENVSLRPIKRFCTSTMLPTHSSVTHKLEHTKLAQPFRSPLFPKSTQSHNREMESTPTSSNFEDKDGIKPSTSNPSGSITCLVTPKPKQLARLRTEMKLPSPILSNGTKNSKAVLRPFKSPFKSPLSSLSSTMRVASSTNIQAMEKKLQFLRRAVKIRVDGEEQNLQDLTTKWISVGREVAWEMWAIVRAQVEIHGWGTVADHEMSTMRRGTDSWGWDNTSVEGKRGNGFEANWAGFTEAEKDQRDFGSADLNGTCGDFMKESRLAQEAQVYEEESSREMENNGEIDAVIEGTGQNTVGTMLRQFGITDETLGWNEDEEDFVDT